MTINKDNYVFSIVMTLLFTVVLVFPLTIAYTATKPIADKYWLDQHYLKTLRALGITVDDSTAPEEIERHYRALKKYKIADDSAKEIQIMPATDEEIAAELKKAVMGNMKTFLYVDSSDDQMRFAGNFFGPGLWGNVSLAIGLSNDQSKLAGLQVLYQVETPGLGGRISEPWFFNQFSNLPIGQGVVFNLGGVKKESGMDAIAGATITSTAVRDIINNRAIPVLKELIHRIGGGA